MPNTPHHHSPKGRAAPAPRPHRQQPMSSTSPAFRWAKGGAVAVALLTLLAPLWLPEMAHETPDAGVSEVEVGGMTDASMGDEWASLPLPEKPGPNQATKCDAAADEVLINGGCYIRLPRTPPCGTKQYEYKGGCYYAVGKRQRPATTVEE